MFKQLSQLCLEADGRYATAAELQFLKDYLETIEQRIAAYTAVSQAETQIMTQVEVEQQAQDATLLTQGGRDLRSVCRRDLSNVLRYTAAAMLFNDLERLRSSLLLWYQTIVRAFHHERHVDITYQVAQKVVQETVSPEAYELLQPALRLNHSILSQ